MSHEASKKHQNSVFVVFRFLYFIWQETRPSQEMITEQPRITAVAEGLQVPFWLSKKGTWQYRICYLALRYLTGIFNKQSLFSFRGFHNNAILYTEGTREEKKNIVATRKLSITKSERSGACNSLIYNKLFFFLSATQNGLLMSIYRWLGKHGIVISCKDWAKTELRSQGRGTSPNSPFQNYKGNGYKLSAQRFLGSFEWTGVIYDRLMVVLDTTDHS